MLLDKINNLITEIDSLHADTVEQIEALRLKYLSKKGEISALMTDFRSVEPEQKKAMGIKINELNQ